MNKAKTYYADNNGNMIHNTKDNYLRWDKPVGKNKISAIPFHAKLKLVRLGWINSGTLFYFEDENGKSYVMNDKMFSDYITENDLYVEGDWEFYQQGCCYSIGLQGKSR